MSTLNFDNTEVAFKGKSNSDLKRAYILFKVIANPALVKLGSVLTNTALALRIPFGWAIKNNIFSQFCGGENIVECKKSSERLAQYGIGTILDYSIEGKTDERDFDLTAEEVMKTIVAAKGDKTIPFCVFKVTGVARFELLERVNEVINNSDEVLSSPDQQEWERVVSRVNRICQLAFDCKQRIFIDAEDSWIQDAIDQLCHAMMEKYNGSEAIVFNTVQLYRHDRLAFLKKSHQWALSKKLFYGVKLVRGAYMEKERKRAAEKGYLDPIQPNKESTDQDFNEAITYCMKNVANMAVCCGSHNEESALILAKLIQVEGLRVDDDRVSFAQLFGMSDHISYNLANGGYNVVKYLPYGPIKEVMPYLLRRAQENTSVKGQTGRELALIIKEKKRREQLR
jgi:proline dehydrogenase